MNEVKCFLQSGHVSHVCGGGGLPATEAGGGGAGGGGAGGSALSQGDEVGVGLLASQREEFKDE